MIDPLSWIVGKAADAIGQNLLDKLLGPVLKRALSKAAREWADGLPDELAGVSTHAVAEAMFSESGLRRESEDSKREQLRQCLTRSIPPEQLWLEALKEQWADVRTSVGDQAHRFFRADPEEVEPHLATLANALESVCVDDESLHRRFVYDNLADGAVAFADDPDQEPLGGSSSEHVVYRYLVERATKSLQLSRWDDITDHAIRGMILESFADEVRNFCVAVHRANWPGTYPVLEAALQRLESRLTSYLDHFVSIGIHLDPAGVLREDKSWKRVWRDDYHERVERSNRWRIRAFELLGNVTLALTDYAAAVRSTLDPNYFLTRGKFAINDALGVTNEMNPTVYIPDRYID